MSKPPTERRFDIMFHGEPLNGTDVSEVKENLRQLFKLGDPDLERMFSGQPISIKKDLDRKTANQYQQALTRAGAKIQLVLATAKAAPGDEQTAQGSGAAQEKGDAADSKNSESTSQTGGALAMLPVGSQIGSEQSSEATPAAVDVSHITLAENEAISGRASFAVADPFASDAAEGPRYPPADHIEIDTGLDLAELGNLLERAEALPPVKVDIDHLSIAEAGATLGAGERAEVAEPPISADLSLADAGGDLLQAHEKRSVDSVEVDTSALSLHEN
ncbi:MAG: hypothetical protein KJP25_07000 [Gammaproteobacteria bacterium]|nr:hypothetical protein [Gammaproteobacteria bacterium]NND40055.1 hypothetical protein [Pseudomonadales bacterium]MBT8150052.1 hypothetical protein [Gammaproteobacteria bacterium]NNL11322.1 hypothetical protein [Pseudomonadales bacterium]NNM10931.1 hypothetical protein [Pseudomonadales bacterium]